MRSREAIVEELENGDLDDTGLFLIILGEVLLDIRDLLLGKMPKVPGCTIKTTGKITKEDIALIRETVKEAQNEKGM